MTESNPPWYMNLAFPQKQYEEQQPAIAEFDPLQVMHNEKIGQADRMLDHTAKALLTRIAIEREQRRSREEDLSRVRNHLIEFEDTPVGINQQRDSVRFSLEQNLMALSREERQAQISLWNDIRAISNEMLAQSETAESVQRRRNTLIEPYTLEPRIP
jgi:hypothetical protein